MKTHSYRDRICVDGRIRIKMKTMTKISQAHVFVACTYGVELTSQHVILSFSNVLVWAVKDASKR